MELSSLKLANEIARCVCVWNIAIFFSTVFFASQNELKLCASKCRQLNDKPPFLLLFNRSNFNKIQLFVLH